MQKLGNMIDKGAGLWYLKGGKAVNSTYIG